MEFKELSDANFIKFYEALIAATTLFLREREREREEREGRGEEWMQIPKKQVRNHAKSFFYIRIRGTFKISLARPATTAIAPMLFYILISVKVRYIYICMPEMAPEQARALKRNVRIELSREEKILSWRTFGRR